MTLYLNDDLINAPAYVNSDRPQNNFDEVIYELENDKQLQRNTKTKLEMHSILKNSWRGCLIKWYWNTRQSELQWGRLNVIQHF